MAYVRCDSCGAKALEIASKCPTCAHPCDVFSASGERMALSRCSGCGIMHRRDRSCHWCADSTRQTWSSSVVTRASLGVGIVAFATIGVLRYGPAAQDVLAQSFATSRQSAAPMSAAHALLVPAAFAKEAMPSIASTPSVAVSDSTAVDAAFDADSASMRVASWVPMVARTWVNVRNDASRGGNVVGVINPSSRAMLGESRGGWRQVRSTDVVGWVDPKLFDADTLRHRE